MSTQKTVPTWDSIFNIVKEHKTSQWEIKAGQVPSNVALSSPINQFYPGEVPPVVFYRDRNAWCPFCERVWLALEEKQVPFSVELIDLKNKPKWYKDLVPTGLVPAVKIEGDLVYESKDILFALEERFQFAPLLPQNPEKKSVALEMIEAYETQGFAIEGYSFLKGKRLNSPENNNLKEEEIEALKESFEFELNELEIALAKYPGSYFIDEFSLVDIIYAPALKRLAANLPVFRGYNFRENENFPLINRWFEAMNKRRAYQIIKSDDRTNNLVAQNLFKLQPIDRNLQIVPDYNESDRQEDCMEAAAKLSANHKAVIADILKNSGIQTWVTEESLPKIEEYVDLYLRLLAHRLIETSCTPFHDDRIPNHSEVAVIGAISLSYLRNRVCVPRDMSAGAATQLRRAADLILNSLYSFSF